VSITCLIRAWDACYRGDLEFFVVDVDDPDESCELENMLGVQEEDSEVFTLIDYLGLYWMMISVMMGVQPGMSRDLILTC
jgi:hypothetical protein